MTKENNVKIVDVGIARIIASENMTGKMGTTAYMSPEINQGNNYDFKTDIWYFNTIFQVFQVTNVSSQ